MFTRGIEKQDRAVMVNQKHNLNLELYFKSILVFDLPYFSIDREINPRDLSAQG